MKTANVYQAPEILEAGVAHELIQNVPMGKNHPIVLDSITIRAYVLEPLPAD